jgi:predicted PolB exonuclease-like 3'-5' exonuclease
MNIFFDIETIPGQPEEAHREEIAKTIQAPGTMKKSETIADWHAGNGKYEGAKDAEIDSVYRKQSFDASVGEICNIAWAYGDDLPVSANRINGSTEAEMIKLFFDHVEERLSYAAVKYQSPFFIGHYVAGFDLKFLFQRACILGIKPPFKIPFDGRHDKDFYDTQTAWCGYRDNIKMDKLALALGIKGKGDMDGSMVWDYYKLERLEEIDHYNQDDVSIVREIFKRLTFGEGC